jgi:hypothetical protein
MSKDAEEYGEEDQPLRWAGCCKIREKISFVWRWGEITNGNGWESLRLAFADNISPPLTSPLVGDCLPAWQGSNEKRRRFFSEAKRMPITLARSYPKFAANIPYIRSWQVTASY